MLDTLANSGAEIDDTPFILKAQEAARQVMAEIERAIDSGEVSVEDVFDRDYQIVEGTNPVQYRVRFNTSADTYVRPLLDRTKATDGRIIGTAIGDMNGYLPTHLTERSHPQGPDPVWNDEHCRNMDWTISPREDWPAVGCSCSKGVPARERPQSQSNS